MQTLLWTNVHEACCVAIKIVTCWWWYSFILRVLRKKYCPKHQSSLQNPEKEKSVWIFFFLKICLNICKCHLQYGNSVCQYTQLSFRSVTLTVSLLCHLLPTESGKCATWTLTIHRCPSFLTDCPTAFPEKNSRFLPNQIFLQWLAKRSTNLIHI